MALRLKITTLLFLSFIFVGSAWGTDYTQDANCGLAYTMKVDESPIDDVSPNNNTGALKGAGEPDYNTDAPSGYDAGCYVFDGSDDYVNSGSDASIDSFTALSAVAWMNPDGEGGGGVGRIIDKQDWGFTVGDSDTTNALMFYRRVDSTEIKAKSNNATWSTGSWQHVALTWDGGLDASEDVVIYYNGVEVSYAVLQDGVGNIYNDADRVLYVGTSGWGINSLNFDGKLTEVAYFSDVLTPTEVNDIIDNGLVGVPATARRIIVM